MYQKPTFTPPPEHPRLFLRRQHVPAELESPASQGAAWERRHLATETVTDESGVLHWTWTAAAGQIRLCYRGHGDADQARFGEGGNAQ
ncbi:hypothetical protein ACFQ88_07100 [Paenibacillus sp. NPDC056579]|uniref:hypothetical protein n=1 Tax=Paenibacillus sp. NPDC056579 TaxID=3345871 RepID=UPI0036C1959A